MTAWQYAQLTITRDIRAGDIQAILWHGPGQGLGEDFTTSGPPLQVIVTEPDLASLETPPQSEGTALPPPGE